MIPDHKRVASMILARIQPNGTENSQDMAPHGENEEISVLKEIAESILEAVSQKDSLQLALALSDFWAAIEKQDEEQDQDMMNND